MTAFAQSVVAAAVLMGSAAAHPYPECEPCAAVAPENLDALTRVDKVSQERCVC